jgi:hypothetical protein
MIRGIAAVLFAAMLTTLAAPAAPASVASAAGAYHDGWRVVDKTTVPAAVGGEGVATVRLPGQPVKVYYTAGNTIPANLKAEGWGHIGDPDSLHGYVFDPYQQTTATITQKMMLVTTPTGQQYEYAHTLGPDEIVPNSNAYTAVTPDGQWLVSSELAQIDRLLVWPAPVLNKSVPAGGGTLPLAAKVLLDKPVRNLQGCDFVTTTRLVCASDDSNNDLYPTSKPLLQIDLQHPLRGKDVKAHVTSLGQLPLASTCVGAYTAEGVDYDAATGDLRVEVLPPSPCNTDIAVYTYRR